MIAFLNLKFWPKSEQVWVMAVATPKANTRQLNPLGTPRANKPGYSYNKVAQI
ncbi:hypothetical protein NIES25_30380 [Nostoc linckia NIES-25]|nr:hypothetical protein NIES25_30380 [Nostoc linckia NIES-25]